MDIICLFNGLYFDRLKLREKKMKRVVHLGLISVGLLFGTLLFATACGIKASEIKSVQKKGYEKELLLSMSRPYKKYQID